MRGGRSPGQAIARAIRAAPAASSREGRTWTGETHPLLEGEAAASRSEPRACRQWQAAPCAGLLGGTSSDGLRSKNPNGLSQKETTSAGITGHSSGRVT